MSLHYLLDGYNITNQISTLSSKDPEEQRMGLVRQVEQLRPQGSLRNKVTIVFDGQPGFLSQCKSSCADVIFSDGESADEKIKRIVVAAKNKKSIVVVTDDRSIQYAVRSQGAKVSPVKEFLAKRNKASSKEVLKGKKTVASRPKVISKKLEFEINSELGEIWLKKNKKG